MAALATPVPTLLERDPVDIYTIDEFLENPYSCSTTVVTRTVSAPDYAPLVLLTVYIISMTICMFLMQTKEKVA